MAGGDTEASNQGSSSSGGGSDNGSSHGGGVAVDEGVEVGDGVVLRCGEELYISYMSSVDAAAAMLSFGFVPPELQQE